MLDHAVEEGAGLLDRRIAGGSSPRRRHRGRRSDFPHGKAFTLSRVPLDQSMWKGIACIKRGLGLDEIAGEHRARLAVPGDDVACGMATAAEMQVDLATVPAELDRQSIIKGERRIGRGRESRWGSLEQPRAFGRTRSPNPPRRVP